MNTIPRANERLLAAVADVISKAPGWIVGETGPRFVQAVPERLLEVLPPIGIDPIHGGRAWYAMEFWIQSEHKGGLGAFWWCNPVTNQTLRNQLVTALIADSERTGIVYQGNGDWPTQDEIPFRGKTISQRWWPKGGDPDVAAAGRSVAETIAEWTPRIDAIVESVRGSANGSDARARAFAASTYPIQSREPIHRSPPRPRSRLVSQDPGRPTPAIPDEFRSFRAAPEYTSIFEFYPTESRIYGTEDWHGDWDAEILFMAKDAGSSRIFRPVAQCGRGWAWVTNHSRPTNRNLAPLIDQLDGGKLYASFLGPLLRNDDRESGALQIDARVRGFVERLFRWTVSEMTRLRSVAVLGKDAWAAVTTAIGQGAESRLWKSRHLSGQPLTVRVGDRTLRLVALNHPAHIQPSTLQQQPGWAWFLREHGLRE